MYSFALKIAFIRITLYRSGNKTPKYLKSFVILYA